MKMHDYVSPCVTGRVALQLESSLLQGSVVESIKEVQSTGQQVHSFEWTNSQPYFNHNWDE